MDEQNATRTADSSSKFQWCKKTFTIAKPLTSIIYNVTSSWSWSTNQSKAREGKPFSEMVSGRSPNVQVKVPMGYREVWYILISTPFNTTILGCFRIHFWEKNTTDFKIIVGLCEANPSDIRRIYHRASKADCFKKIQRFQSNMVGNMQLIPMIPMIPMCFAPFFLMRERPCWN